MDLFSGIGGIAVALEPWVRPIAYCERDAYAQGVLVSRMDEGSLTTAPIWDDVKTLKGPMLPLQPDIIYGGFPCQDISAAGRGAGLAGERSGLFREIERLTRECRPAFVFLENVPAIRTRGLREVVRAFTNLRYDCRWTRVSAASVGAPHLRERWFLLAADTDRIGVRIEQQRMPGGRKKPISNQGKAQSIDGGSNVGNSSSVRHQGRGSRSGGPERQWCDVGRSGEAVAYSEGSGLEPLWDASDASLQREDQPQNPHHGSCQDHVADAESLRGRAGLCEEGQEQDGHIATDSSWWFVEPNVGRVVDGLPNRMDRVKGLGNAVVPLQARIAFMKLLGIQ